LSSVLILLLVMIVVGKERRKGTRWWWWLFLSMLLPAVGPASPQHDRPLAPRHARPLTLAPTPFPAKATPYTAGIVGITAAAGERLTGSYPHYLDLASTAIVTDVGYKVFRS